MDAPTNGRVKPNFHPMQRPQRTCVLFDATDDQLKQVTQQQKRRKDGSGVYSCALSVVLNGWEPSLRLRQ